MTPSFERLDYLLRANKHIERKLVFDVLLHAQQILGFPPPSYLGFGSMWFGDFRLAHRLLGLQRMMSIEREVHAARANFNKPYDSITVRPGECLAVIKAFSDTDWQSQQFAWFDFDGSLNDQTAEIIETFVTKTAVNSVLIITVNGLRKRYSRDRVRDRREETSVAYLEQILGEGAVDPTFYPKHTPGGKFEDIDDIRFRELLANALLSFMLNKVRIASRENGGKRVAFVPLFNLCHEDGAPMITVGGAIADETSAPLWTRCLQEHQILEDKDGFPVFRTLDLIPITIKEKLTLDACLPLPAEDFLSRAIGSGIKLSKEQIELYRLFNRHFPVFVESPI